MAYYKYAIPESNGHNIVYGKTEDEIIKAIEANNRKENENVAIPEKGSLEQEDIHVLWLPSMLQIKKGRKMSFPVLDDVIFTTLDINGYDVMREQIKVSRQMYHGLCLLLPDEIKALFLPPKVIEAARNYDWSKHDKELSEMRADDEAVRIECIKKGYLMPREML